MFQIKTTGIKELREALFALERKIGRKILVDGLKAGAVLNKEDAKDAAPEGETGNFKRSIRSKQGKRKTNRVDYLTLCDGKYFDDGFYPAFYEYGSHNPDGTWHIQPRAMFRHTFEKNKQRYLDKILQVFKDGLEERI